MIISYSNNFAFIRIPKTGSTSATVMIYDSDILDKKIDCCTGIENGSFGKLKDEPDGLRAVDGTGREEFNINFNYKLLDENLLIERHKNSLLIAKTLRGKYKIKERVRGADFKMDINISSGIFNVLYMHNTWNSLYRCGLVDDDIECISTIRHPIDRFISICYFFERGTGQWSFGTNDDRARKNYFGKSVLTEEGINGIVDRIIDGRSVFMEFEEIFLKPQHYWIKEGATVWNTENVVDWAAEFVNKKGGAIKEEMWAKNNKKRPRDYLNPDIITLDRQKYLLDRFEKDFLLWENSYKRYN